MANNKNQHFVPESYLKRFSNDEKSIGLFNLDSKIKVENASISKRCSKKYFYGKNLVTELELAKLEGEFSKLFKEIDKSKLPPIFLSEAQILMAIFILVQYSRTEVAAESLNDSVNNVGKQILKQTVEKDGKDINNYRVGLNDPVNTSLVSSIREYPLILDLKYKLLINKTNQEFIISDNPIIFYNQLFALRKFASNCGVNSKGLQIFFPLDQEKMIMLYDSEVYCQAKINTEVIKITELNDIINLNILQLCSANKNVYFKNNNIDIEMLHKKASPYIRKQKSNFTVHPSYGAHGELVGNFLHSYKVDICTNLMLSFLRVKKTASKWIHSFHQSKNQLAIIIRDQQLLDEFEQFKNYYGNSFKSEEFIYYYRKKYGISSKKC